MEINTVEEQTTEMAIWSSLDEHKDESNPGLEMLLDGPSTDFSMADSPVTVIISDEIDSGADTTDLFTYTTTGSSADSGTSSDDTITIGDDETLSVEDFYQKSTVAKYNKSRAGERNETGVTGDYSRNPLEKSHLMSTDLNHNTVLAKEPVQTSTTADHDEGPAREPGEIFDTADFHNLAIESSDNGKVEIKPFNFLGCPDDVLRQILCCILVRDRQIKPYWNLGALEVAADQCCKENFTTILVAFAGNRKLIDEATTVLYSENVFKLQHAKVSLWWLRRIGSNVSKIKTLIISVEEGVIDGCGTRCETLWYSIFLLLEAKHTLQSLKVSFARWTYQPDSEDDLDPDKASNIWEPRYGVVRILTGFRGLDRAIVTPGPYVTRHCAEVLEDALVMSPGQTNEAVTELEQDVQVPKRTKYLF